MEKITEQQSDMFNITASQLIRQRYSCRTYQKRPIADQTSRSLERFFPYFSTGPRGNQTRFQIMPASEYDPGNLARLGTYGFIKDPAAFIAGAILDKPGALEDFGYSMELLILKATELELGSCWLGGTFTKSRFVSQMDLSSDETIPSVAALGYPSNKKGWLDRGSRIFAGADRRLPWDKLFFRDRWSKPFSEEQAGLYREPLKMVRLAPSASNKQPWRLLQKDNCWHFFLERTPNYPGPFLGSIAGIADLQRIDLGIATAHFDLATKEAGIAGDWTLANPQVEGNQEYILSWQPVTK